MGKWLLFCGAGAVVGYVAVYFALDTKPAPLSEPVAAAACGAAAEPSAPSGVVDVANLDALLDARPVDEAGVPFEAGEPSELTAPASAPTAIPMAAD